MPSGCVCGGFDVRLGAECLTRDYTRLGRDGKIVGPLLGKTPNGNDFGARVGLK